MSTRLSETIASLHETRIDDLKRAGIDAEGVAALADALKVNTTVTMIDLRHNGIGVEGASALADALKINTS
jgi:Ran GTPase-activating protein (RanGAP) involved in mRNA processing and transport